MSSLRTGETTSGKVITPPDCRVLVVDGAVRILAPVDVIGTTRKEKKCAKKPTQESNKAVPEEKPLKIDGQKKLPPKRQNPLNKTALRSKQNVAVANEQISAMGGRPSKERRCSRRVNEETHQTEGTSASSKRSSSLHVETSTCKELLKVALSCMLEDDRTSAEKNILQNSQQGDLPIPQPMAAVAVLELVETAVVPLGSKSELPQSQIELSHLGTSNVFFCDDSFLRRCSADSAPSASVSIGSRSDLCGTHSGKRHPRLKNVCVACRRLLYPRRGRWLRYCACPHRLPRASRPRPPKQMLMLLKKKQKRERHERPSGCATVKTKKWAKSEGYLDKRKRRAATPEKLSSPKFFGDNPVAFSAYESLVVHPDESISTMISETVLSSRKDKQKDSDPNRNKVFIGGVTSSVDEKSLRKHFEKCGIIRSLSFWKDSKGRPNGVAFITFISRTAADHALAHDGSELDGRKLTVQKVVSDKRAKRFVVRVSSWIGRS